MEQKQPQALVEITYATPPQRRWAKGTLSPIPGALVTSAGLIPVLWLGGPGIRLVLTGELFRGVFYSGSTSGPNPSSIYIAYYFLALLMGFALPYCCLTRHVCDRSTRAGYWSFCIPAVFTLLPLAVFVTLPFYWTILYMRMGLTPSRLAGLGLDVCLYVFLAGFTAWAIWPERTK